LSAGAFEAAYGRALYVDPAAGEYDRIVLVDDVCTEGSTLSACATALWEVNPSMDIVLATAGQMTVRAAVKHEADLVL
jgi:predicted amidophosphoribosyltransferase